VTQVCRPGCVRLLEEDGTPLPNPWNIEHLRKFYPSCSGETIFCIDCHSVLKQCLEQLNSGETCSPCHPEWVIAFVSACFLLCTIMLWNLSASPCFAIMFIKLCFKFYVCFCTPLTLMRSVVFLSCLWSELCNLVAGGST
jgi:hypothetical protein